MNINEINKKLRRYVDESNSDQVKKVDTIDLIEYFEVNQKIEVKDGIDYLYEIVGIGWSNYSYGTVDGHRRIFFDPTKDEVVYSYTNNRDGIYVYDEYRYDQINDRMIDKKGKPIPENFKCYGAKRAKDEFLSYYKFCKNSKPYFRPLYIDMGDGFYIDSELNIYIPGVVNYYDIRIIANLNNLLKYLLDDTTGSNKCAIELRSILKGIRIRIDELPSVYRDFIENEKSSDSKVYVHKPNIQY